VPLTVFTEGNGLFHKGSNGKSVATGDVCLTPAPAGPVPVPYVNTLVAEDLARGSRSVKVDGHETALESTSYIATSRGDAAGSQGGNVVTHTTCGRGSFKTWSFTFRIEGQGVCRHGDLLGHNARSSPAGCVGMKALTQFQVAPDVPTKPCDRPFERAARFGPDDRQADGVRAGPCWECARDTDRVARPPAPKLGGTLTARSSPYTAWRRSAPAFTPDHQPPLGVAWQTGGCHLPPGEFERWATSTAAVRPHCAAHAASRAAALAGSSVAASGEAAREACERFLWGGA